MVINAAVIGNNGGIKGEASIDATLDIGIAKTKVSISIGSRAYFGF